MNKKNIAGSRGCTDFTPEPYIAYPLCVGGKEECENCNLYTDFEAEEEEQLG